MKNEKGFVEILAAIGVLALIIFGVFISARALDAATDRQCNKQFGAEWVGKSPLYSPDMCINKDGEVKYPL